MNDFHKSAVEVIANVLGVPVSSVSDGDSPVSISSWDSLKQMQLIVALEERFKFRFDEDEQLFELLNVGKLIRAAEKAQKNAGASANS